MQELADFVAAVSHQVEPPARDGAQFTGMRFHPRIDGGIALDSAVESQILRPHRASAFCFQDLWFRTVFYNSDSE
jgi:hypothetical protein